MLGTRATFHCDDLALFRQAKTKPTCPALLARCTNPIPSAALHHLVSSGAQGWLCDLSITRISTIANAQLPPTDLSYFCFDGTFFSQLCHRRGEDFYLHYSVVRHRFEDWLEDTHPLNRSLLCIPSNSSGSHWTGTFLFLDQRIMLHVDSLPRDSFTFGSKELSALRYWLTWETTRLLQLPYISATFRHRLTQLQDLSTWSYSCRNSPCQENGNDCGVYYLMHMIYTLQGRQPLFSPHDIPFFRQ